MPWEKPSIMVAAAPREMFFVVHGRNGKERNDRWLTCGAAAQLAA
jgi:hypothetical protein